MNLNERNPISDGELLQVNATVIAGTLIFLTIGSLGEFLSQITTLLTAFIVVPFCYSSAGIIISGIQPTVWKGWTFVFGSSHSKNLSTIGFGYLVVVLVFLALFTLYQTIVPVTPADKCAINPENYNITQFTPGSLAQDCALQPGKFHVVLKQCSKFITS